MNVKDMLRGLLGIVTRFVDTDKDGKIEIADLPGALAQAAALQARGLALLRAGEAVVSAVQAAAQADALTSGGQPITAEQVTAAWAKAKAAFDMAADEAQARLDARAAQAKEA